MPALNTATPATACSEPALIVEQLGGQLNPNIALLELQAQRLGFAFETAIVIATLAWGIAR